MTRLHEDSDIPPSVALSLDLAASPSTIPLRIVSFNVRYSAGPEKREPNERPWEVRCPKITRQLDFITTGHDSAFVCLQECLYPQVRAIQDGLGDLWAHIGRGRGDGPEDGEFSPIFYRPAIWRCERSEVRWLSPTPDRPSRGWDAMLNRIVTIGEFSHIRRKTRVVVMSTHFDHLGVEARKQSARLLVEFAREWNAGCAGGSAVPSVLLIGGDFNSPPTDGAYQAITAPDSGIADVLDLVPEHRRYGNQLTFTGFNQPVQGQTRIDYLFIQEPRTAHVNTFGTLSNTFDDHISLSDHRPVVADLDILV